MSDYQAEFNAVRDAFYYLINSGEFERMFKEAVTQAVKESMEQVNTRADSPDESNMVPRSRYDACNRDWLEAKAEIERVKAAAKAEIERIQTSRADIPEVEALVKAAETLVRYLEWQGEPHPQQLALDNARSALAPFRQRRTDGL